VPIGIFGLIFSVMFLEEHREGSAGGFDLPGFVLAGLGLAMILFALSEGPTDGWGSPIVLGSMVFGIVAIVVLVVVESHVKEPMLDLKLLADRSFRTPNIVSFAATGALIGVLFLLPQFLQGPYGLSPLESGLTTFPQAFGVIIMARIVGQKWYPVIGPRRLAFAGTAFTALITAGFMFVNLGTSQWTIRVLMFTRGLAIGLIFIPIQAAAFARIETKDTGRASALYQTGRQVGSATGVAILATILVVRGNQLAAGVTDPAQLAKAGEAAFHDAILGAVVLCVIGAIAALFLHDEDAAPTMRPKPGTPLPASLEEAAAAPAVH
jgi:hypothetical protein